MQITVISDFTKEECITCGVFFFMPNTTHSWKKRKKEEFYCPNGHSMAYTESEEDKLRRQLRLKDETIATLETKLRAKPKTTRKKK